MTTRPAGVPEEERLLAAIRERPDEDAPRLVWADAIAEHGQTERAELVIAQCRLAELSPVVAPALSARAKVLLEDHGWRRLGGWGPKRAPSGDDWTCGLGALASFRRGLLDGVCLRHLDDAARVAEVVWRTGCVRELTVSRWSADSLERLWAAPWGQLVNSLTLSDPDTGDAMGLNGAALEALGPLRSLTLEGSTAGRSLKAIAARGLPALRRLCLTETNVTEGTLVAARNALPSLQTFEFSRQQLSSESLRAIASGSLKNLSLSSSGSGLAWLGPMPALERLVLDGFELKPHMVDSLAECPRLERLSLGFNELGRRAVADSGVTRLATSPLAATLTHLKLDHCSLRDGDLRRLGPEHFPKLVAVDLRFNELSDTAIDELELRLPGAQVFARPTILRERPTRRSKKKRQAV